MTPMAPMTSNEQEALSKRYVIAAVVTPLDDGNFAVFASDRSGDSLTIVDEFGLAIAILSLANRPGRARNNQKPAHVDPDDFGL